MCVKVVIQQQVPNIITKMQLLHIEQAKLQHNIKQKGEEEFLYLFSTIFQILLSFNCNQFVPFKP